jgi:hypothetical protein
MHQLLALQNVPTIWAYNYSFIKADSSGGIVIKRKGSKRLSKVPLDHDVHLLNQGDYFL